MGAGWGGVGWGWGGVEVGNDPLWPDLMSYERCEMGCMLGIANSSVVRYVTCDGSSNYLETNYIIL